MKKAKSNTVFYNHGPKPIYLSYSKLDPLGGPDTIETKSIIGPGQGIDVSILNLKSTKPKAKS